MQFPWYVAALGAAVVWGLHYPLIGYALKRVSIVSVLFLTAVPILLLAPFFYRQLLVDYTTLIESPWTARSAVLAITVTSTLGALLLFLSIAGKNATLAALIEISYPVFVALFAWLVLREMHLNLSVAIGAAFVFIGVAIIIWNNG